jgi:hypothetical protein
VFIFFQTIPLNITTAQRSHDILLNETTNVTVVADVEPDSQQMSSAASLNDTARGALDRPLESHGIVPEVASVGLLHTIWVLIFIEHTIA